MLIYFVLSRQRHDERGFIYSALGAEVRKNVRCGVFSKYGEVGFMESLKELMAIANSTTVWLLCGVTVIVSLIQTLLFTRMANNMAKEAQIGPEVTKTAFRVGLISAIGPAIGVFIVMVGLMATIGSPMAWLRLSIIGAAATELTSATLAARAAGSDLGAANFTITVMAVTWFAMALNGSGWLLSTGLLSTQLEKLREKVGGGDVKWLAALSGAASLGVFGYLNHSFIRAGGGSMLAVFGGALGMVFLAKVVLPKCPKLAEYALGIAMLFGMACAVVYDVMAL